LSTTAPDLALFNADLADVLYLVGEAEGRWGLYGRPEDAWPNVIFWVAAAPRDGAPKRFHLRFDWAGYPAVGPTGAFWDVGAGACLEASRWPKGREQVAAVFKPGCEGGRALYHPFDRVTWRGHGDWPTKYPGLAWTQRRKLTDHLEMIHGLLNSRDYTGV
jgi:hypothetical protein